MESAIVQDFFLLKQQLIQWTKVKFTEKAVKHSSSPKKCTYKMKKVSALMRKVTAQ